MATVSKRTGEVLPTGINVETFLAWYNTTRGRYELHDGDVYAMSPARVQHGAMKFAVQRALFEAVRRAGLPCHVLPDSVAIHVSDRKWYEPDALVYCGPKAPGDDISIANPIIVAEVASPSTVRLDETVKLSGYFEVPSVQHYLIVYPEKPIVHHQRQSDGTLLTRLLSSGPLRFDPPGIEIDVAEIFN